MTATRRLAAILAADVAGYSRLIGADEGGTLQVLKAGLIDPTFTAYNGRLVKTPGDWLLVEFGSVVDALRCATEVEAGMGSQRTLRWRELDSNSRSPVRWSDVSRPSLVASLPDPSPKVLHLPRAPRRDAKTIRRNSQRFVSFENRQRRITQQSRTKT